MIKIFKRTLLALLIFISLLAITTFLIMQQKTFGKNPSGARLSRIENSVNYRNGAFQNLTPTEVTLKDASYIKMMRDFFNKPADATPQTPVPSIKTDLKSIKADKPVITWFGHSSYLIQCKEINFLVDPVFSGNASPVSLFGKSFQGANEYGVEHMPTIDYVILTHDHYDHLDYKTISRLYTQVERFYMPLGVGAHLEHWGVPAVKIVELDWWEGEKVSQEIELIATPARHFSGRAFQRNKTLWASYVLKLYGYRIHVGGDSGYETHFKTIGDAYGPFDLAILEAGQYGDAWPYIHMLAEETVQAAKDLKTSVLFPVHWGKFALAYHAWNEPIERVIKSAAQQQVQITTPRIGQPIVIDSVYAQETWWR